MWASKSGELSMMTMMRQVYSPSNDHDSTCPFFHLCTLAPCLLQSIDCHGQSTTSITSAVHMSQLNWLSAVSNIGFQSCEAVSIDPADMTQLHTLEAISVGVMCTRRSGATSPCSTRALSSGLLASLRLYERLRTFCLYSLSEPALPNVAVLPE